MGIVETIRTGVGALPRPGVASPLQPRRTHLASAFIAADLGIPTDRLTRETALQIPVVARAHSMVVPTTARIPLSAVSGGEPVKPPIWVTRSDKSLSPYHRMLATADDIFFYGSALWYAHRDYDGTLIDAEYIARDRWNFGRDGVINIDGRQAQKDEVIFIPGYNSGILEQGRAALSYARELAQSTFKAASTPNAQVVLKQVNNALLTDEEIDQLLASYRAARRGDGGGVLFISDGVEVKEFGSHAEHLLIEGRRDAAVDVARVCGVPAAMVDASMPGSSLSYSNTESRMQELITFGIQPMLDTIAARLSMDDVVPRGTSIQFDKSHLINSPVQDDGGVAE